MIAVLVPIPREHAAEVWPLVGAWMDRALARDGRHAAADVVERCRDGRAVLWAVMVEREVMAGIVTEVDEAPLLKTLNIWLVAGRNRKRWVGDTLAALEGYARKIGCRRITAVGRKGWAEDLAAFDQRHVVYAKDLTASALGSLPS